MTLKESVLYHVGASDSDATIEDIVEAVMEEHPNANEEEVKALVEEQLDKG
jgi:ABC-type transporter Mla maintaining outer membrane lipid asymmetry ATPase subunit MlaF